MINQHDNDKITEKYLSRHITKSVVLILVCMFLMSFAAYAFFEASVESKNNFIIAGNFDVDISIQNETETVTVEAPSVTDEEISTNSESSQEGEGGEEGAEGENKTPEPVVVNTVKTIVRTALDIEQTSKNTYGTTLKQGKNIVTISYDSENNTDTGFCIFKIKDANDPKKIIYTYVTSQLGKIRLSDDEFYVPQISFTLNLNTKADLEIITHWGTSSNYVSFSTSTYSLRNSSYTFLTDGDVIDVVLEIEEEEEIEESIEETTEETNEERPLEIVVKDGDMLYDIATEYGFTVDEFVFYNNIDDRSLIVVGQVIKIPPADWTMSEGSASDDDTEEKEDFAAERPLEIVIKEGDSLFDIALKYGNTVEELVYYNDLEDARHIEAGQTLKLPPVDWEIPAEEPSTEEPSTEEPSTEEPSTEEPSPEEPSAEEPSTEEPSTEEPSTEEPSPEEPSTEEPSDEEPSAEEPSTEETPTEETPTDTTTEDTSVEVI